MDGEILQKPYIKWKILYLDSGNIIINYSFWEEDEDDVTKVFEEQSCSDEILTQIMLMTVA